MSNTSLTDAGFNPVILDDILSYLEQSELGENHSCIHLVGVMAALLPQRKGAHDLVDMVYSLADQRHAVVEGMQ